MFLPAAVTIRVTDHCEEFFEEHYEEEKEKTKKKSIISSSPTVITSLLPTISRLRTISTCRDNARLFTSKRAPLLVLQHTSLLALASLPGYTRDAKEIKATGQG